MEVIFSGHKEAGSSRGASARHLELPEVPEKGRAGESSLLR